MDYFGAPQILNGAGVFGFYPTGYEISPGAYRIHYSQAIGPQEILIKRGTLKPKPQLVAAPIPTVVIPNADRPTAAKRTAITCVKGKVVKKIKSRNPKCPRGF